MAEPKKKLSKTRENRRRAMYRIADITVAYCKNCNEPVKPHTICPKCGFYKGVNVIKKLPTERIVLDENTKEAK